MLTLNDWLTDWINLRTPLLKPRTIESYTDLMKRYIEQSIGTLPLKDLSAPAIIHVLAEISAAGHSRTSEMLYVFLRAALRDLDDSPMRKVRRPVHVQHSPDAWTNEQIAVYVRALANNNQRLPLLLGILLGLRRGEICGLRWSDIDFRAAVLHIRNQRQRMASGEIVDCSPKSLTSNRDLPIPAELLPLLKAHRQLTGYVCTITPSGLDAAHRRLVHSLGLPYIPLHGLRHSMATACIRNGGDMRSLQSLLGHASYATTANRYTHPDSEMLRKAIACAVAPWYNVLQ